MPMLFELQHTCRFLLAAGNWRVHGRGRPSDEAGRSFVSRWPLEQEEWRTSRIEEGWPERDHC